MALYPDLTACGIHYMHFWFHVTGGYRKIEEFWKKRGLDGSDRALVFAGYSRRGNPHTVSLQWFRTHQGCCDVLLGLDAVKPQKRWPRRKAKEHRLREEDFHAFIDFVRGMKVPNGLLVQYAFPWNGSLESMVKAPPRTRAVSVTLEVVDDTENPLTSITYQKFNEETLAIVEPIGRFRFLDEPVSEKLFQEPYKLACLLAKSLRKGEL